jgi:chromosome condensin MukBEF MukE localization factor
MQYTDKQFVQADLILRRGGHITTEDVWLYEFLAHNFDELKVLYAAYGCLLMQHEDSFFFLIPEKDGLLRTKELSKATMHVGQVIAFLTRDPEITRTAGTIGVEAVLHSLAAQPVDVLRKTYAPTRGEATIDEGIRQGVQRALRTLATLGFIRWRGDQQFQPTNAINRFAELARHANGPDDDAKLFLSAQRGVVFDALAAEEEMEGEEVNGAGGDQEDEGVSDERAH